MGPKTSEHDETGDAWGRALLDHYHDERVHQVDLEVDDGTVVPAMHPEWFFRDELGWEREERQLLERVTDGPVLDLGPGAGRAAPHLQERGVDVTAVESSPGAVEVFRRRGQRDVRFHHLNEPPSGRRRQSALGCGSG